MRSTLSIFGCIAALSITACLAPPDPLPPLSSSHAMDAATDTETTDATIAETDSAPPGADAPTEDVGPADAGRDTGPAPPYFVGVTAGEGFACAWTDEGRRMCWGQNLHRQANPTEIDPAPPNWAPDAYRFETIDAGPARNCGLTTGEEVVCWGRNAGDVVQNGNDLWLPPTQYELSTHTTQAPTSVVLGWDVMCVTTAEPAAFCWGDNDNWQVEPGGAQGYLDPTKRGGVAQISPGASHSCELSSNGGRVSCWGENSFYKAVPSSQVLMGLVYPRGVDNRIYTAVSAGVSHTCGIVSDGTVACWGSNNDMRLGVEPSPTLEEMPVVVPGPTAIVGVDVWHHACALASDGRVWCWGRGDEDPSPFEAPDDSAFESVTVGGDFSCATSATGVWCWGNNQQGRAGQFDEDVPVAGTIDQPTLVPPPAAP